MFKLADRVKETSITNGSGISLILNDTFGGFQSFATAIGNGNSTYYTIENGVQFEIGIGTYYSSNNSLSRDTVLLSTNSNQRINLDGISIVFVTYPSNAAYLLNTDGYATSFSNNYSGIKFPDGTIQITAAVDPIANRIRNSRTISTNNTINSSDDLIFLDSTLNELNVTMPTSISTSGYTFTFKKISGDNNCTIIPQSGEYIDSQNSFNIHHINVSISLFSNGLNWYVI